MVTPLGKYIKLENQKLNNGKDFLMVGGMGHTAMTALGVSSNTKNVLCIDGDGSFNARACNNRKIWW